MMFTARVVGEVVATTKHRDLVGHKLLLVQPVDPADQPRGMPAIALDAVDAGVGDRVLVVDEGNSAAQVLRRPRGAVRTVVVGVIDDIESA
ncbi:MAG TPA: EutN/CcmL family microcompartment protein [Candidatus Eisenbacteria bacterium]|jgi:ethanolamine utilization protein EutN